MNPQAVIGLINQGLDLVQKLGSVLKVFGIGGDDVGDKMGQLVSNSNKILVTTTQILVDLQKLQQDVAAGFTALRGAIDDAVFYTLQNLDGQYVAQAEAALYQLRLNLGRAIAHNQTLDRNVIEQHRDRIRTSMFTFFRQENLSGNSYASYYFRTRAAFAVEYFLAVALRDQMTWDDIRSDYIGHLNLAIDANRRGSIQHTYDKHAVEYIVPNRALITNKTMTDPQIIPYEEHVYVSKKLVEWKEETKVFRDFLNSFPADVAQLPLRPTTAIDVP